MRIIPVESINRHAAEDLRSFITASEEEYRCQLELAADGIIRNIKEKPIVLICGPSGSGKTVSAHRVKHILEKNGQPAHIVSMDNYFLPVTDFRNVRDNNGNIDLESPKRLDTDLLNKQLDQIWRGDEVVFPEFDFAMQTRKKGKTFKRRSGDAVILEGIHALNPEVTGSVYDRASKVYVSVRTRISITPEKLLHPSKIRLMRRLVRDRLFRGRALVETVKKFRSVERGEKLYIAPFKHAANYDIDTFIHFGPCVYKKFLINELLNGTNEKEGLDNSYSEEMKEIHLFLDRLCGIDASFVPPKSLIREFIGGNSLMK